MNRKINCTKEPLKIQYKQLKLRLKSKQGQYNYCMPAGVMKLSRFLICMNLQLLKAEMSLRKNIIV
jgi:hypothetical protein